MFVKNVQLVELPEGIAPGVIRFEVPDNALRIVGSSPEALLQGIFKILLGGTYWEVGFADSGSTGVSICTNEIDGEVVKACPQIVNDIANYATQGARNGFQEFEAAEFLAGLRFRIEDDAIRIASMIGSDLGFKLRKMVLGPVDLYPDAE